MNYNDIYHEDLMQKGLLSEALQVYSIDFDADTYTIADIEALPENIRMELLDGKMYYMASPLTIHQRICHGAPDWIIEIVSPGSRRMDYHLKLFKYHSCGVREYWIVDPHKKMVSVHNFFTDESFQYTFRDTVKVNLYEDFSIDFSKIRL